MKSHSQQRPYSCNLCGMSCSRADHLYLHRRTIHPESNVYQCVCGQDFAKLYQAHSHRKHCVQRSMVETRTKGDLGELGDSMQ